MKWGILSGSDISDAKTIPPYRKMKRQADSFTLASSLLNCLFLIKPMWILQKVGQDDFQAYGMIDESSNLQ